MNKKTIAIILAIVIILWVLFIIYQYKMDPTNITIIPQEESIILEEVVVPEEKLNIQNEEVAISAKDLNVSDEEIVIQNWDISNNIEPVSQNEIKTAKNEITDNHNDLPIIKAWELATQKSMYIDTNGDTAIIPKDFKISQKEDEQIVNHGLVIIGPDNSEFVRVPTTETEFKRNDFWTSFYTNVLSESKWYGYWDDINNEEYKSMKKSVETYSGFYMWRYEASKWKWNLPILQKVTQNDWNKVWVQVSPQDITTICKNMYIDNDTVASFFPYGVNYDTVFQWLIDTHDKTEYDIMIDSSSWGNYTNSTFTNGIKYWTAGMWKETKANNIYDLAGNYWEWTQERYWNDDYVMRGGGYNIMWMACNGDSYPVSLRDPLPWNNHHPNVGFRVGLYIK